jgi:hypothetical protein
MDVSHFGLFDVTRRAASVSEPPSDAPAIRIGSGWVANDNDRAAGRRRMPRPRWSLFGLLPRRGHEPGAA